ncbi:hypothetical protein [Nocardioides sp.]|uniref:hypothetical protein n=1 Tax=Nocardioides sp. TaxID=35761 RepID=UPI002BC25CD7|nr:hypothetical protein [Nocardioides sp.]HXH78720.1 hypothetical protein [Nocardioides sp.]
MTFGLIVLIEDTVEGDWVDRVVGLDSVRTRIAILQTADGHGRLEPMKLDRTDAHPGSGDAPANTLGMRRIAFAVRVRKGMIVMLAEELS